MLSEGVGPTAGQYGYAVAGGFMGFSAFREPRTECLSW